MTMTISRTGLDSSQRTQLERIVSRARATLEADLRAQAEGRFGIHIDGTIEEEQALPDDASDRATRRDLVEIIEHVRSLGESQSEAVSRLLREASFTHLNRLLAIRIAEAIGLLPESLANGRQSRGFKDLGEIMPILGDDYWGYLLLCGDELAADAPALFDPRNPLLALAPSTPALEELVALLSSPDATHLWLAPDTLGWTYQFFNTTDERRSMREGAAAPRTSRELAVRNQFFTPRYVVDFLVQNSLGRRLVDADPSSGLADVLPLLVDPPTEGGTSLSLEDVRVLDPACGSGHFLLGCYELLELAWTRIGVTAADAAPRIMASLWGIDIDPRCAQVASAALVLRARSVCPNGHLPRPNIVTARTLPDDPEVWDRVLDALPPERRRVVEALRETLRDAPVLGSLLKAEEHLSGEIRDAIPEAGGSPGTLFAAAPSAVDAFGQAEKEVLAAAQELADQAGSTPAQRLFAAEADDAIRFVEALRQRYDAVLMNPPFGRPIEQTRAYLYANYTTLPTRTADLFAAFVSRGVELCRAGGYVGAITPRAGMFLTTFREWRREVLLGRHLVTLADLGLDVMDQALVEAAAYVVGATHAGPHGPTTFIRLLKDQDRPAALAKAIADIRSASENNRVYRVHAAEFNAIPGHPIAYWMAPTIRELFAVHKSISRSGIDVRVGLQTSNDPRFVRALWEISPTRIARTPDETEHGMRWVPFAKGGEYSPYWSDVHLVVDWLDRGRLLWEDVNPKLNKPLSNIWMLKSTAALFFMGGITWSRRTNSGFSPRVLPMGSIFADKGPALIPSEEERLPLLAWLNSRLAQALLGALVAAGAEVTSRGVSKSYEVGLVQNLPWPLAAIQAATAFDASAAAEDLIRGRVHRDTGDETARSFVCPSALRSLRSEGIAAAIERVVRDEFSSSVALIDRSLALERELHAALALTRDAEVYLDAEIGPHAASYPRAALDDESEFARLFTSPIGDVIDEVVSKRGGARAVANLTYAVDRRMEVLAHTFERHPSVLAEARERLHLLPPGEPHRSAEELLSYLIGVAFGRWDVRIGRDPTNAAGPVEAFGPVPRCPPGMLVDTDGLPVAEAQRGYPVQFPPDRLLIDEPGHARDVEAALRRAAAALFPDPEGSLSELKEILGRRPIREHLRKQFFKDHLSRYSKSRRKAPIYWPLAVPSRSWGVWIYAPTLSRETLYAVASETARRERLAVEAIARLQREQQEGGLGRPVRKIAEELDSEETLVEELRRFHTEAQRIAGIGWEPNLDDGIVLCAAPLADLFPAWPDAKKAREELRKGDHEWATVAQWAGEL